MSCLCLLVYAETVDRQREEVQDEKQNRSAGAEKQIILSHVIQMEKLFFQMEVKRIMAEMS